MREENIRLQRKLQREMERREALCRQLSESESSLEMDDERYVTMTNYQKGPDSLKKKVSQVILLLALLVRKCVLKQFWKPPLVMTQRALIPLLSQRPHPLLSAVLPSGSLIK